MPWSQKHSKRGALEFEWQNLSKNALRVSLCAQRTLRESVALLGGAVLLLVPCVQKELEHPLVVVLATSSSLVVEEELALSKKKRIDMVRGSRAEADALRKEKDELLLRDKHYADKLSRIGIVRKKLDQTELKYKNKVERVRKRLAEVCKHLKRSGE
jgi:hypothetical protein